MDPGKEAQARTVYRRILFATFFIVFLIINFVVVPKVTSLYNELNVPVPTLAKYGPWIGMGITLLLALTTFGSGKKIITNDSGRERIQEKHLFAQEAVQEPIIMILLGLLVGLLAYSIVFPIYDLTTNF